MTFVPAGVCWKEISGSPPAGDLTPEESQVLGAVSDKRRREFADGRACAREALKALGVSPSPILIGTHREPIWPAGIVGSITHCERLRAAAVARADLFASIGIDAEPKEPLPLDVRDLVILPDEDAALSALAADGTPWDRLLFCAKESFYKAWFPLTRRWLDFTGVAVSFVPDRCRFRVDLRAASSRQEQQFFSRFEGRFHVTSEHVLAFYAVDAVQPHGRLGFQGDDLPLRTDGSSGRRLRPASSAPGRRSDT